MWTEEGRKLHKPGNGYQAWTITEISPSGKYKLSHNTDVIEVTDNAPGKTTKMFSVVHPIPVRQAQEIWNSFPIKNETIEEAMLTLSDVRKELYRTHIKKARQVASHYRNMHKNDRRATER